MFSLLRPYIFGLDPEVAHDLAIKSLKFNVLPKAFFHVDEEEMLHALEADWSQSWKRLDLRPNTKIHIFIPTGKS